MAYVVAVQLGMPRDEIERGLREGWVSPPQGPDPNVWVGYGDRTVDEMAHAWVNVTYMGDKDYAEELAARRERLAAKRGTQQQQQ